MPESIVLLHGFGGTRHAWDGVVAHLDAQRYRPLALDLPGHGSAAAGRGRSPSPAAWRRARPQPGALHAVRLLARRAHRPARRADRTRPRGAAGAGVEHRRHRGSRPSASSAAAPTSASPASSRRSPTSASSSAGAPSRCSPPSRRRSPSSPARISAATAPARSRARCGASARGRWSPSGVGSASWRCRSRSWPARTIRSSSPSPAACRSGSRDGELHVLEGGHALALECPRRWRGARGAGLRRTAACERLDPQPRPVGDARSLPRAAAAGPRGPRTAPASPARSGRAGRARRGRRRRAPRRPRRAVRRGPRSGTPRRRRRAPSAAAASSAADAAAARELQADRVGGAGAQRARLGGGLVDRHARLHRLAHAAHVSSPWVGSSTSSRPMASREPIAATASGTLQAPLASTRSPTEGPTAARTAASLPASSPTPDLDLDHAEARPRRGRGLLGGACAILGGDRRVNRHAAGRALAQELRQRAPRPAARQVPQRDVDRGERRAAARRSRRHPSSSCARSATPGAPSSSGR